MKERKYSYPLSKLAEDLKTKTIYQSTDFEKVKIYTGDVHRPGLQLAGFFDHFEPNRIQLIGHMESAYLEKYQPQKRLKKLNELFKRKIPALIMCHGAFISEELIEIARKHDITVLSTKAHTTEIMSQIIRIVRREVARRQTQHGVLVEVYGMGLLLRGESGVGKSEAAIELLKRGHRLIADDAVEIKAIDYNVLQGTSPDLIRYYVELRGLGVVDVRRIFGLGAIKAAQNIHLVINLEQWQEGKHYDRLGTEENTVEILGVLVPTVTIPVKPGRNLAIIIEVAAMNQRQKLMGINTAVEFARQIDSQFSNPTTINHEADLYDHVVKDVDGDHDDV